MSDDSSESDPLDASRREALIDAFVSSNPSPQTRRAAIKGKFQRAGKLAGNTAMASKRIMGDTLRVVLDFEDEQFLCSLDPAAVTFETLNRWVCAVITRARNAGEEAGLGYDYANQQQQNQKPMRTGRADQRRHMRSVSSTSSSSSSSSYNDNDNNNNNNNSNNSNSIPASLTADAMGLSEFVVFYADESRGTNVEISSPKRFSEAVLYARSLGPSRRLAMHVKERPREEPDLTRRFGIGTVSRKWEKTSREHVRFHTRLFLDRGEPPAIAVESNVEQELFKADEEDETFARICLSGIVSSLAIQRVPINLIMLVDCSSSMKGKKVEAAKAAAKTAADSLQAGDRLTVVSFASIAEQTVPPTVKGECGESEWRDAMKQISGVTASGATDMQGALTLASELAQNAFSASRSNRVLLITDGKPSKSEGLLDSVVGLSKCGICTTTLGIGDDFNEDLLSDLAKQGLGSCYYVKQGDQMVEVMKKEIADLSLIVGRQCKITVTPMEGVSIAEVYGYPCWCAETGDTVIEVGDIKSNTDQDVLVRIGFSAQNPGLRKLLEFSVDYLDTTTKKRRTSSTLAATFSANESEIAASIPINVVVERVAKARTAKAMREAMKLLDEGDVQGALVVLDMQSTDLLKVNAGQIGEGSRGRLGKLANELGFHKRQAARKGGAVDKKSMRKELAMRSRQLDTIGK